MTPVVFTFGKFPGKLVILLRKIPCNGTQCHLLNVCLVMFTCRLQDHIYIKHVPLQTFMTVKPWPLVHDLSRLVLIWRSSWTSLVNVSIIFIYLSGT